MIVEFNSLFGKDGYSLKQSSKYLLMAAANIVQQLDDLSSAAAGMDIQGKKFDSDYFFSAMDSGLHTLLRTLQSVADEEETDISAAYIAGHDQPDPVDRNRAPAGRIVT